MTSFRLSSTRGFTLVEMVMVVALVAILSTIAVLVTSPGDAMRFEATRGNMEKLRWAILGQDTSIDNEGHRTHFGYHGDVGALPSALVDLVTRPAAVPAWTYSSTYGVGSGWHGPYVSSTTYDKDGWGRSYVYAPGANPPSLKSLGADGAVGGTGLNEDLTFEFATTQRLATVVGIVSDKDTRVSGKTIAIRYPVSGTLTAATVVSDANGAFSFSNVPFGVRALNITTVPLLGPKQFVIDKSTVQIPNSVLNYQGASQGVTYVTGSASTVAAGKTAIATLSSTYSVPATLAWITVTWPNTAKLSQITINGVAQAIAPTVTSGTRVAIVAAQIFGANTTSSLWLEFTKSVRNKNITLLFEYTTFTKTDTVAFTPI